MRKLLPLFFGMLLILNGCSLFQVHKMDIEQGNVFNQDMAKKIHRGMTPAEVENIMGTPVLTNTFRNNRIDYVYTFQASHEKPQEQYMTLIFQKGRLQEISGNMYSAFIKD
jgi:outer membrane protein assembly factor BamE